jgi:dTDP-4-amino-4,6-dideoxygalactose transaminase
MTVFGFLGAARVSAIRGGNWRISEYAAAVGLAALDALPARLDTLRRLAGQYRASLDGKASRLQEGAGDQWATMTLNVILPEGQAEATTTRLDAAGIEWRRWWGVGCHRHRAFADVPRVDLASTDALAPRVLGVPFHDDLAPEEIEQVVACLP